MNCPSLAYNYLSAFNSTFFLIVSHFFIYSVNNYEMVLLMQELDIPWCRPGVTF